MKSDWWTEFRRAWRGKQVLEKVSEQLPDPRRLEMSVLLVPESDGLYGRIHAGTLVRLLDRVAIACASQFARRNLVTLSMDPIVFGEPVHAGERLTFRAAVNHTGHSLMEIGIRVEAEDNPAATSSRSMSGGQRDVHY